jgi:SOS-response transcriptional repressor LexA
MSPTFEDGDRLAVRPPFAYEPTQGQIVVADLGDREVVKRVTARDKDSVFLEGDNRAASTDPGFVNRSQIKAVVIVRYWPLVR